jgi:hypothetical protein
MEQYWLNEADRVERNRIHIDRNNGLTICGQSAREQGLKKISKIEMQASKVPTCSRCIRILKSNKYGNEDTSKYNQTKKGLVDDSTNYTERSKKMKKDIQLPKKIKDEVTAPELKKFHSILKTAKQKKIAIQNAINEATTTEEEEIANIERLRIALPEMKKKLLMAISDEYQNWEDDHNNLNDGKHFCNVTALRNLSQAIEVVENL